MNTCYQEKLLTYNEQIFRELYKMDTIINMTKKVCEEKEFTSQYYGIPKKNTEKLSEERNHYINMLSMAADKVSYLIKLNNELEKTMSLDYNRTPTIAADK